MGCNKNYRILTFFSVVKVDVGHSGCSTAWRITRLENRSVSVGRSVCGRSYFVSMRVVVEHRI